MSLLIKNISIKNPEGENFSGFFDILLENKKIKKISRKITTPVQNTFDGSSLYIAPGFIDLHCHLRDPGYTHKEDIESGGKAAFAGGFTTICPIANTNPVCDSPELIMSMIAKGKECKAPTLLPFSAISKALAGKELVNFSAQLTAGAVAFSDDGVYLKNEDFLKKALEFSKKHKVRIALHEEMPSFEIDTRQGEIEAIKRDLNILSKTGGSLHIMHVSLMESCKLINAAKKSNLDVTCEVTPHHLFFSEDDISAIGTNAKCNPPLRTRADVDYLVEALSSGLIDVVATDHAPHSKKEKNCLYNDAPNGIIGFQTAFNVLLELVHSKKISLVRAVECLTIAPSRVFNIKHAGGIAQGEIANLVIFNLDREFKFTENLILSKSKNSPFIGKTFKGGIKATIYEGHIKYLSEVL